MATLHAALQVAEQILRDEHPHLEQSPQLGEHHAPLVVATARLIVDHCGELRRLLDFYDAAVDQVVPFGDDSIPF